MWIAGDNRKAAKPARALPQSRPPAARRPSTGASGPVRRALGGSLIAQLDTLCTGYSNAVGPMDVALDLAAVGTAVAASVLTGNLAATVVAVTYIGVRQRHLSNLAHECVHAKIVRSTAVNKALGYFLTTILGEGFEPYRVSHQVHHAKLGQADDPMFDSYVTRNVAAPTSSKTAFVLRVIVVKALWVLPKSGLVTFFSKAAAESRRSATGRAAFWATVTAASVATGWFGGLLIYWLLPLVFVRPTVTWITDLGNHAGVIDSGDPIIQTRGWTSHWLTRHLLGGHLDDMFHPVHHWCPRIPWRRLPQAAAILRAEYDRWPEVPWCSGYFFRRRSTPDTPCVIEDIITRLQTSRSAPTTAMGTARQHHLHLKGLTIPYPRGGVVARAPMKRTARPWR